MNVADILETMARQVLPDGHTYANHDPMEALREMRLDVIASHAVDAIVSRSANPVVIGLYKASRPVIDGMLTASVRSREPKRIKPTHKRKKAVKPGVELAKRSKGVEREILDAEFVDL